MIAPATAAGHVVLMTACLLSDFQASCWVAAVECHKTTVEQLKVDLIAALSCLRAACVQRDCLQPTTDNPSHISVL